jgi:DNA-binding NtrC family response regulator
VTLQRVLLVEPDGELRRQFGDAVGTLAHLDMDASFPAARTRLFAHPYDWLITNVRLEAYNGLHLVHLAGSARLPVRILVYSDRPDLSLAREAQRLGAFYESCDCVHRAIAAYLRETLPLRDRRDPAVRDRRALFRGGRRCTDSTASVLQ